MCEKPGKGSFLLKYEFVQTREQVSDTFKNKMTKQKLIKQIETVAPKDRIDMSCSPPSLRQQPRNYTHDTNGGLADVSSYPAATMLACLLHSHDAMLTIQLIQFASTAKASIPVQLE